MSLWTDARVKELMGEVVSLKARLDSLEGRLDPVTQTETPEELVAAYVHRYGKKPHHWAKPETIREALK